MVERGWFGIVFERNVSDDFQNNAVMYFIVGTDIDVDIDDEIKTYEDIIQVDINENYHNITYKVCDLENKLE